ncbi:MAG: HAD family phosphatase [Dermabacter sp.]|nr:HAD family phosphatase [Dermabacter sp.]
MSTPDPAQAPDPLAAVRGFRPAGVVFDCDGLILDTESLWEDTQQAILAAYGARVTPAQEEALMGTTLEQSVAILAEATGQPYDRLLAESREDFTRRLEGPVRFMPGAKAFVELVASKVPIAVASNSWHTALVGKLTRAGIIDLFANVQSADTVEHAKPAPDMYARAAEQMGFEPRQCLAFEDSPVGARAAVAAGLTLIGVPSTPVPIPVASATVDSLEDPGLIAWVSSWPDAPAPA